MKVVKLKVFDWKKTGAVQVAQGIYNDSAGLANPNLSSSVQTPFETEVTTVPRDFEVLEKIE